MVPGQQASAKGMAVERAEDEGEPDLAATTSMEAAGVADMAMTTRTTDAVAAGSKVNVIFATRVDTSGAIATSSLTDGLLFNDKMVEEHEEGEEEAVEAVAVVEILWDLHEDRDVYNEMWQIPVVPMPKERQVAAIISTKGEAVGSGDGANGRAKEIESKKCKLGGTNELGEHEESGAAAKKQQKGEENLKAAAEEEYGDSSILQSDFGYRGGEPDEVLGCPTCMQAKFSLDPFTSSESTVKAPLDEVVMDMVGPLKFGAAGAEYFLTIVDVYTRMNWVYVLSKKSDVAETVKTDWLPMVEQQHDRFVKAIRTDQGEEFLSKDFSLWLKKSGIRHSLTMPYSPAMNGIVERANRTITETARGFLIEAGLPDYFWPDAVWSARRRCEPYSQGAAIKGWVVKQMDVTTAFLNGILEEEIFMAQPEGFDDGSGRVLKLKKALYGPKQAPRQWYLKMRGDLEEIGFTSSTADHSLFMLGKGEHRSFIGAYVDDILIFSPSSDLVKELMLKLQEKFKSLMLRNQRT
ncbi:unnamed protein product [Closterium sp. NIES-53]